MIGSSSEMMKGETEMKDYQPRTSGGKRAGLGGVGLEFPEEHQEWRHLLNAGDRSAPRNSNLKFFCASFVFFVFLCEGC